MNKAALLGAVLFFPFLALAGTPMTFKEISMLLRNGEQQSYIQEEAGRRKLAEPLTPQKEAELTALGASPALLNSLRTVGTQAGAAPEAAVPPPKPVGTTPPATPSVTSTPNSGSTSLYAERKAFATRPLRELKAGVIVPTPPDKSFQVVTYHSPIGELSALLTVPPKEDKSLHPAIIWIIGGWGNSISSTPWTPAAPDNDQSARAFAQAGIITLYPSFRGGNTNPGSIEHFYGEVDDIVAAADFLAHQPGVDPQRIYLGGHSTGGTLVLLVAEYSERFRAVFALGPVAEITRYSKATLNFDLANPKEVELRSPVNWLHCIHTPTYVFEGSPQGNIADLNVMQSRTTNPMVHFYPVNGMTHFSQVSPLTHLIATKILEDKGPTPNIVIPTGKVTIP